MNQLLEKIHSLGGLTENFNYKTIECLKSRITPSAMVELITFAGEFGLEAHDTTKDFINNNEFKNGLYHITDSDLNEIYIISDGKISNIVASQMKQIDYTIEELKKINDFLIEQGPVPFTHDAPKSAEPIYITNDTMAWITEFTSKYPKLQLTPGGNIKKVAAINWGYYIKTSSSSIELFFLRFGDFWRFITLSERDEGVKITGLSALKIMEKECGELLAPFALRNREKIQAIKDKIEKYNITLTISGELHRGQELRNIYHIDLNSAFPAGVIDSYPEFTEFFENHYALRKINPESKAIMNYAIGASQSLKFPWRDVYPELARAGIAWTNKRLRELTEKLENLGYLVLGYNTDGLFYYKPDYLDVYHDEDEGTLLGQWKTDHKFEKIRFKSAGSYEYLEYNADGELEYHPVVRGETILERPIEVGGGGKPRSEWVWGDIFQTTIIVSIIDNKTGKITLEEV